MRWARSLQPRSNKSSRLKTRFSFSQRWMLISRLLQYPCTRLKRIPCLNFDVSFQKPSGNPFDIRNKFLQNLDMHKRFTTFILGLIFLTLSGCGGAPFRATLISAGDRGGAWIEDLDSGLHYCVSRAESGNPDPICYAARKPSKSDNYRSTTEVENTTLNKPATPPASMPSSQEIGKEPPRK